MERNRGLELIIHKFINAYSLLGDKNYQETFIDLKDVGVVFESINAFSWSAFIFTKNVELGTLLREIEFVIIKSVANHIMLKYKVELSLKYPDPDAQKYYSEIKPLPIEDLLRRCQSILKKCKSLE